ncbi:hypothetical protein [Phenylobacterium sp.]|uniref:hypothetical protein n=1 Tax=Phenylobacterium sp. TaxID=1871053 RepID=UPI0035B12F4B
MSNLQGEEARVSVSEAARRADDRHVAAVMAAGGFGPTPDRPAAASAVAGGGQMSSDRAASPAPSLSPSPLAIPPRGETARRAISPLTLTHVTPGMACAIRPRFEWTRPGELLVDEAYQRQISDRSLELIRKIVANWDWRRFKPPVVASTDAGLVVIDGQHTAIAAATHPEIDEIPVMIVVADDQAAQAKAFVGQNRDRLGITQMQIHFAAVAAGDEDALTIDQVCARAGVKILRCPPGNGAYRPGDTVAVHAIGALVNRRGAQKARIVLQALAEARCAPINAGQIKAVEMLLHDGEYRDHVEAGDVTSALMALGVGAAEQEAKVFAAAHNVPQWRALGIIIFRRARRGRRRTD